MSLDWKDWHEETTSKYSEFSASIPSDLPAYEAVYELLKPEGKTILDFGCYEGNVSAELLRRGATKVHGVDIGEAHIKEAQRKWGHLENASFAHVQSNEQLPIDEVYDAVNMTFVHPTIPTKEELQFQFKKILRKLKSGGSIVLLGLHPDSFLSDKSFLFYGHKLPECGTYADSELFANELRLPEGQTIRFFDYCWTVEFLNSILHEYGTLTSVAVTLGMSAGVDARIAETKQKYNLTWKDEWTAPLYQIFVFTKK